MIPAIRKAIEVIDEQIAKLQAAKANLLAAFSEGSEKIDQPRLPLIHAKSEGRKNELVRFLREHGPAKRSKIIKESGIPKGTIAFLLSKNPEFAQVDGKWTAKPEEAVQ